MTGLAAAPGRVLGRAAPWLCAALHALAAVALVLWLRGGAETETDPARRAAYVAEHAAAWRAGWAIWMLAAGSLVAFYSWWAGRLPAGPWTLAAVGIGAAGMVCDVAGESLYAFVLPGRTADFAELQRTGSLLTAGLANALYTTGGVILTLRTPDLPRGIRLAMWTTWAAGAVMTASAALGAPRGLVLSSAVLFPLFVAWTAWMARSWRTA